MTPKLKKIIMIILLVIVLFVLYAVFIKKDPTNTDSGLATNGGVLSGDARLLGNQISQALIRIEQIQLDRNIFSDQIYKTLVDRSEPIVSEPMGKSNPFAPIGNVSVNSTVRNNKPVATTTPTTATTTPRAPSN